MCPVPGGAAAAPLRAQRLPGRRAGSANPPPSAARAATASAEPSMRRDPRGTGPGLGPGLGPGWDRGRDRGWDGSGSGSRCPRGMQSPRSAVCTVPNITTHGWTVYPPSRPVSPVPPRVPAQHHRPVFVPSPGIKKISRPREKPPLRSRRGLGQNRDPPESPPGSERKETQRNRLIAWFNSIFPPQFWAV